MAAPFTFSFAPPAAAPAPAPAFSFAQAPAAASALPAFGALPAPAPAPAAAPLPRNDVDKAIYKLEQAINAWNSEPKSAKFLQELLHAVDSYQKEELVGAGAVAPGGITFGAGQTGSFVATYDHYDFKKISYGPRVELRSKDPAMTDDEWLEHYGTDDEPAKFDTVDGLRMPLTPYAIDGFEGIQTRLQRIEQEASSFTASAATLNASLANLTANAQASCERAARLRQRQIQVARRLLRVARKVDMAIGHDKAENREEMALRQKLAELLDRLYNQERLQPRVDRLIQSVRMREDDARSGLEGAAGSSAGGGTAQLDDAAKAKLGATLQQLHTAVSKLVNEASRRQRHCEVAADEIQRVQAGRGARVTDLGLS